ncbi:MAG TPA: maleylpyruvate isomerase family mycothiol-dependent enzyme [Acidimicrobiales bacterium]|nr:maleylpyruvate isomerase family mycothiol-dependent enzyme [Acidimicrobiales bacterium]
MTPPGPPMPSTPPPTIGEHYRATRERLTDLLAGAAEADWARPVPACPGWDVHDVVAHLVALVDDALTGRLTGPPSPQVTAEQVARLRDEAGAVMLARWAEQAPLFEQAVTDRGIWPAAFDVGAHEQDVRGALGRPGARDCALVRTAARLLIEEFAGDATIVADLDDEVARSHPGTGGEHHLRTTPFEVFRFRLGRRSRQQVAELDWTPVPDDAVLDSLFIFGPATAALVEEA